MLIMLAFSTCHLMYNFPSSDPTKQLCCTAARVAFILLPQHRMDRCVASSIVWRSAAKRIADTDQNICTQTANLSFILKCRDTCRCLDVGLYAHKMLHQTQM